MCTKINSKNEIPFNVLWHDWIDGGGLCLLFLLLLFDLLWYTNIVVFFFFFLCQCLQMVNTCTARASIWTRRNCSVVIYFFEELLHTRRRIYSLNYVELHTLTLASDLSCFFFVCAFGVRVNTPTLIDFIYICVVYDSWCRRQKHRN